jgi:hypothetical protein
MACRALSYLLERLQKIEYHEVLFDFYEQLEKWAAHSNATRAQVAASLQGDLIPLGFLYG